MGGTREKQRKSAADSGRPPRRYERGVRAIEIPFSRTRSLFLALAARDVSRDAASMEGIVSKEIEFFGGTSYRGSLTQRRLDLLISR